MLTVCHIHHTVCTMPLSNR